MERQQRGETLKRGSGGKTKENKQTQREKKRQESTGQRPG